MIVKRRMGRTLGIETSGRPASLAVLEDDRLLGEASVGTRSMATETLLEVARRLLLDLGLSLGDLDRIAVSEGPGSFTGLRVGMAAALGLAAGSGLPLVAVPSLEVLAYPWRDEGLPIVVVRGLRRGWLHLGLYRWGGERFDEVGPPASRPVEELLELPSRLPGERFLFVGDALDSLEDTICSRLGDRARCAPPLSPRAADVASLAADPMRPEWTGRELEGRTPNYLRGADARRPRRRV